MDSSPTIVLTTWVFVAAIILAFFSAFFFLEWPLRTRRRKISAALNRIRKMDLPKEDLSRSRLEVRATLGSLGGLSEALERWERVWRSAFREDLKCSVCDATLVDFVREYELLPRCSKYRLVARAVPGILVAGGILGTFLGLVQSLPNLANISHDSLQGLIRPVLEGLNLAFYTSLAGIGCSIIFIAIDRIWIDALQLEVNRLSDMLAPLFPTLTRDQALARQMETVEDGVHSLRTMATDLATSISDKLEPVFRDALSEQLAPIMEEIQETVKLLAERAGEKQNEGIQQLVDGFMNQMNAALGAQFLELGEILKTTVEEQAEIKQKLAEFQADLQATGEAQLDLIEKTLDASNVLNQSLEGLKIVAQLLQSGAEKALEAGVKLEEAATTVMRGQTMAMNLLNEMVDSMEKQAKRLSEARDALEKAWTTVIERAAAATRELQQATSQIEGSLVKALETFDGKLGEVLERFSGTLSQVDGAVGELPAAANQIVASSDRMAQSAESLQGLVKSLHQTVVGVVAENVEQAVHAASGLRESVIQIDNAARALVEGLSPLERRFAGLQGDLSKLEVSLREFGQQDERSRSRFTFFRR